jgi:hypothetical protein
MSLASYVDLVKWTPSHTACGETLDVDSTRDAVPVEATLSQLDESGTAVFVRNVPLWVMRGAPVGLSFPDDPSPRLRGGFRCWAIIAEPMSAEGDEAVKDSTLFAAAWPYSRGWWGSSPFKQRWNNSREALNQRAAKALQNGADWRDFIRELPENAFSTQKKVRKAVLLDPNKIAENTVPGRYFNLPRHSAANGTSARKFIVPSTCYGLCRNPEACRKALSNDPFVRELIDATLDRSLFRRFHRGHQKLDVFENARSIHPKTGLVAEPLANTDRASEVLSTAITFALAGPESFKSFRDYPKGSGRKLVASLVRDIYLELMWNLQRRTQAALFRRAPKPAATTEVGATEQESGASFAESAVRELAERLRSESPGELHSLCRRALHDFDHPAEVRWQVADGAPVDEARPDDADEIFAKLWETCVLAAALSRLGLRDPRLAACVEELADDPSPSVQRLSKLFGPLM